jgi:hypothetical protein
MKKIILGILLGILICLVSNIIEAYGTRYKIRITARGRTVYSDTISEHKFNYKWKYIVPYSFRDGDKNKCRVSAYVEIIRK